MSVIKKKSNTNINGQLILKYEAINIWKNISQNDNEICETFE